MYYMYNFIHIVNMLDIKILKHQNFFLQISMFQS